MLNYLTSQDATIKSQYEEVKKKLSKFKK